MIHGQNFRLKYEGTWEKFGFYTPRFADAPDPLLAEHTALEDFRHSAKFRDLMEMTLNSDDDPPILSGEDVEEIIPGSEAARDAGLALYKESLQGEPEPGASPNGGTVKCPGGSEVSEGPPSVS